MQTSDARVLLRVVELRPALAVRGRDRHAAAGHAGEQDRRARRDLDQHEARLELLGAVAHEHAASRCAPGMISLQRRHHLAAVAGAEREGVGAREEALELGARARR